MNNSSDNYGYQTTEKQRCTPYFRAYYASISGGGTYNSNSLNTNRGSNLNSRIGPKLITPKSKRTVMLILIIVLMVAVIGVYGASFIGVLPFGIYEIKGEAAEAIYILRALDDEDFDFEELAEDEEITIAIGADDIIYSFLKKLGMEVSEEQEIIYYDFMLEWLDEAETPVKIAAYLIPISIVLSIIMAVVILIKAIIGLAKPKRRKMPYLSLILFLVSLLGVAGGFIWSGVPIGEITGFLFMSGETIVMGLGLLMVLAIEIVAIVISFFAYKSAKKSAPYLLFADGSIAPYNEKKKKAK